MNDVLSVRRQVPVLPEAGRGRRITVPALGTPAAAVGGREGSDHFDDARLRRIEQRVARDPAVVRADHEGRRAAIREAIASAVREEGIVLGGMALARLVRHLVDHLAGLGPLEALLRDRDVTDVMVNGPHEVWIERRGRLEPAPVRFADADALRAAVQRILAPLGLRLDRSQPYVDARLPDGSRLHAVLPPLAPDGPIVTIRRFSALRPDWEELKASGAVPAEVSQLLRDAVTDRRAIVCCGRTGTGKTTLLDLLVGEVGADERVIVVEDASELRSVSVHTVRLETRTANAEGAGAVPIRDLVRQALRMRPDRIVVGEVRGVELVDVLQALATGHEGCMTTVHARAAHEALVRLEGMALLAGLPLGAVRAQLAVCLDLLVVLGRGPAGQRGVVEVAEVTGQAPGGAAGAVTFRRLWERRSWRR